jgi:hypothetical protein
MQPVFQILSEIEPKFEIIISSKSFRWVCEKEKKLALVTSISFILNTFLKNIFIQRITIKIYFWYVFCDVWSNINF